MPPESQPDCGVPKSREVERPAVSLMLCTRNRAERLRSCLEYIAQQNPHRRPPSRPQSQGPASIVAHVLDGYRRLHGEVPACPRNPTCCPAYCFARLVLVGSKGDARRGERSWLIWEMQGVAGYLAHRLRRLITIR
jgi:hypothetical protein